MCGIANKQETNMGLILALIMGGIMGWLASKVFGSDEFPAYKVVFIASGVG